MCFSSPTPPNPVTTAQQQNSINAEAMANSARYNRTNQTSPFGSQTYSGTPGTADDTLTTTLSPELQKLLTGQIGISQGLTDQAQNRLSGIPKEAFSLAGAPSVRQGAYAPITDSFNQGGALQYGIGDAGAIQHDFADAGAVQRSLGDYNHNINTGINTSGVNSLNTDFSNQLNSSRNAAYNSQAQYLDPRFAREQQSMESQLAAQGIPVGSEAYKNAMAQFGETKNQAYQGAADSATLAGNQLQGQLFGQNLSANQTQFGQAATQAQFGNTAQQQSYEQALGSGQFGNDAQSQYFGQLATRQQMGNAAQSQLFDQLSARQQANNATAGQAYSQNMGAADFANQANMQKFGMTNTLRDQDVQNRQQNINENILSRNQNFNELAAFLNGSPISPNQPAFQNTPTYQAAQASPDAVGLSASNYQAQSAARAAMLSSAFQAAGQIGGAAAKCWVAREVYGIENPRWLQFREWLTTEAPRWFHDLYVKHGERFALWLHDKPRLKSIIRRWMDSRIHGATHV